MSFIVLEILNGKPCNAFIGNNLDECALFLLKNGRPEEVMIVANSTGSLKDKWSPISDSGWFINATTN